MSEPSLHPRGAGRRLVVTNPFVWPYVRRGSERLVNDLSAYLAQRGHEVSVFASAPDAMVEKRGDVTYHLLRERLGRRPRQINSLHSYAWRLQRPLAEAGADAVFCLNYFDAWAALRARQRLGARHRVIFLVVGLPSRRYFRAVPLDAWFMHTALHAADRVVAVSRFAAEMLASEFGVRAEVLPVPVVMGEFEAPALRLGAAVDAAADAPVLLFAGDADQPRKGAALLCRAFVQLRAQLSRARLVFSGQASADTMANLLALPGVAAVREGIEFRGLGALGELPGLYRSASVTVLPAVFEALGMALIESLASGTPVVAARHGGALDIVAGPLVGQLFDPGPRVEQNENEAGLVAALLDVVARGKTDVVRSACVDQARRFSWETLGPRYESLLVGAR